MPVTFTDKFHYFQVQNSTRNYTLSSNSKPVNSKTTDLQPNSGSCKFQYLQVHTTP